MEETDSALTERSQTSNQLKEFIKARIDAFESLKHRDFRWYWIGMLASYNGMQMQMVARGWLVYTMTESPFALGLVTAGFGLPLLLLSLHAGALADRLCKRNMILYSRLGMGVISLVVTLLIATDLIAIWHLVVASVLSGVFLAFYLPARQAFVKELVGQDVLLNAIAMNSMAMNICRVASPALAGVLLKVIGIPGVYWIVTISAALVVFSLLMIPPDEKNLEKKGKPLLNDVKEGLRFVVGNKIMLILMLLAFVPFMTGMSYQMLLPVFAKSVFDSGETGLGLLMSATGIGALVGSTVLASLGDVERKGLLTILSGLGFGIFMILFGLSNTLSLAFAFLLFVGGGSSVYMALNMTLVMSQAPEKMVGRVMSIYMMTFGLMPVATLPAGALAELIGAPATVVGYGGFMVAFLIVITLIEPKVRKLK
ncbi:MAG: MFS transporter [Proteobacteria bacterium]|nr:MFS transporter [Pseudomonadota bacterium]